MFWVSGSSKISIGALKPNRYPSPPCITKKSCNLKDDTPSLTLVTKVPVLSSPILHFFTSVAFTTVAFSVAAAAWSILVDFAISDDLRGLLLG